VPAGIRRKIDAETSESSYPSPTVSQQAAQISNPVVGGGCRMLVITLLNVDKSNVHIADRLLPHMISTRRVNSGSHWLFFTDTVGFIQKLPSLSLHLELRWRRSRLVVALLILTTQCISAPKRFKP
jgi:hypothetical protein